MLVNEGLVTRHVEDIAFLWTRRHAVLRTNRLTHADRVGVDARLDAHIEGALLAGEAAQRVAVEALASRPEPGSAFAAAVLALKDASPRALERTLATVEWDDGSLAAIASAIGWSALADVGLILARWARGADDRLVRLALAGFTSHRRSPGAPLARCLQSGHPALRAAAAKAVGELGAREHAESLADLLTDPDTAARFQAARALARFGDARSSVRDVLIGLSESSGPFAERAVGALVHLAPEDALSLFRRWAVSEPSRRLALVVAETLGSRELVDALIPWMSDDGIARGVGEAFRTITGADLVLHALSRPRPTRVPGDPNDDPDDPNVELPRDYELPFPSGAEVAVWWGRANGRYASGVRYLDGQPVGANGGPPAAQHLENLRTLVRSGRPRHQAMAARALAQAHPALPTIETHAFASSGHVLPGWEARADGDERDLENDRQG